jgi:hypothetical protein
VFSIFATGPKVRGFKPGREGYIFKINKICSTTSFGEEIRPPFLCRKNLRHVKDPYSMKAILVVKIRGISRPVSPVSILGVPAFYYQRCLVGE